MTIRTTKRPYIIASLIAFMLLLPLVAMQFTDEVAWSHSDFIVAAVVLLLFGAVFEAGMRITRRGGQRLAVSIAILLAFLLTWAELAVGVFGTPLAGS